MSQSTAPTTCTTPHLRFAQIARSIVARSSNVEIGVLSKRQFVNRHLIAPDGSILINAGATAGPCLSRLTSSHSSPTLDMIFADVAAVAQPERVRGIVTMRGRVAGVDKALSHRCREMLDLDDDTPVARFAPTKVHLDWRVEVPITSSVKVDDYRTARHDVLCGWEGMWGSHLNDDHQLLLMQLAARRTGLDPDDRVRVLLADREGLVLRCYGPTSSDLSGYRDVRVHFSQPVSSGQEAVDELNVLCAEIFDS